MRVKQDDRTEPSRFRRNERVPVGFLHAAASVREAHCHALRSKASYPVASSELRSRIDQLKLQHSRPARETFLKLAAADCGAVPTGA